MKKPRKIRRSDFKQPFLAIVEGLPNSLLIYLVYPDRKVEVIGPSAVWMGSAYKDSPGSIEEHFLFISEA